MQMTLTETEANVLRDLLRHRLEDLSVEVRRTESPAFHDELRALEDMTRALLSRLEVTGSGGAS